jgi:hypothetical protein
VRTSAFLTRDFLSGLVFFAVGALFLAGGANLALGTARSMGAGYFPMLLSIGTMLIGAAVMARSLLTTGLPVGSIPWRALTMVTAAIASFGLTVRGLGFVPAVIVMSVLASLAEPRPSLPRSAALAAGLALFCGLVFVRWLGMPYSLFGPWLGGR